MINLDTLRKSKGHVLALVDEKTGKYEPINADVVEVIRCKDCIFFKHIDTLFYKNDMCTVHDRGIMPESDFCSWAERKEE